MEFTDHEGVQIAAGDRTAKSEGSGAVGGEGHRFSLSGVCLNLEAITIQVKTMDHIGRCQFDGNKVSRVNADLRWRKLETAGLNPKLALGRRFRADRQRRKRHQQCGRHQQTNP